MKEGYRHNLKMDVKLKGICSLARMGDALSSGSTSSVRKRCAMLDTLPGEELHRSKKNTFPLGSQVRLWAEECCSDLSRWTTGECTGLLYRILQIFSGSTQPPPRENGM